MRILFYGYTKDEMARLRDLLLTLKIPFISELTESDHSVRLGSLIRMGVERVTADESGAERLVIFHALKNAEIERFREIYAKSDFPEPTYAMTNETSLQWTLGELLEKFAEQRKCMRSFADTTNSGVSDTVIT